MSAAKPWGLYPIDDAAEVAEEREEARRLERQERLEARREAAVEKRLERYEAGAPSPLGWHAAHGLEPHSGPCSASCFRIAAREGV